MKRNLFILTQTLSLILAFIIFNSSTSYSQWVEKARGLRNRSEVASVVYDSKLYTFLGFANSQLIPEPSSEVYDPATNTWKLLASITLAEARTHQGVVLVDNTVWHIGGRVGQNPGALASDIWIYNISTDSWSRGPELKDPATGEPLRWGAGGAVLLGRTLHIVGGFANTACRGDQSTYHLTLNVDSWLSDPSKPAKWENELAPLPVKRNHFATVALGGKIYVIGGQFGHDCQEGFDKQYSHVYDPATDSWKELPLLPTQRSHIEGGTFAIDGKIYVVAGQGNEGKSTNYVTVFDPEANGGEGAWSQQWSLALPRAYEGVSSKVIGSTFIVSHGGEGSSYGTRSYTYTRTIQRDYDYKLGFSSGCLKLNAQQSASVKGTTLLFTIDGTKNYTTSTNASWLKVTRNATGTAVPNAVDIEVTANTTGLAPGTYNATITATGTGDGPAYSAATYCVSLTVTPPQTTKVTLQAENALLNGVAIATNHNSYTGTAFADFINPYNDFIEWTFDKDDSEATVLQFRYSNGKESDRPLRLEVNGVLVNSQLSFPTTGSWENWGLVKVSANLKSGVNKVRITAIGYSGANVDCLSFTTLSDKPVAGSIANVSISDKLSAYVSPNPVIGNARLVVTSPGTQAVELELLDMLGKRYQKINFSNNGTNTYNFSVRDLPYGMYVIKVKQGNNQTTTKLIVGNKIRQ